MYKTYFDAETKEWRGKEFQSVFDSNASIGHILLWCLNRNPLKISQVCRHRHTSRISRAFSLLFSHFFFTFRLAMKLAFN